MTDLVDYLRGKLELAKAGCTCPAAEWLSTLPLGTQLIVDCVEHGRRNETVGGFGYLRIGHKPWWRR